MPYMNQVPLFIALVLVSLQYFGPHHLHAQYLDNRDEYATPYARHNQMSGHRQSSSNLKSIQPIDDLSSSQSLFMMDFKRQAIVIPEANEKSTKSSLNRENHTVFEKYIIDANSPEYQQLLQKMTSVDKRPPYFLTNQAVASTRSTAVSKLDSELEHLSDKESGKMGLLKNGHKYIQAPYDSANYHQIISSKLSIDSEKKEGEKYLAEDKAHIFQDRMRSGNSTMGEEKTVKHLQIQLRTLLESLLTQLNDLKQVAEYEIKKMSPEDSRRDTTATEAKIEKGHSFYDNDMRHYNVHYLSKYDSA